MRTKSDPKLIYDVGMHNGDDTAYYLWRGFRVIAIEANPELVAAAAKRFRREIAAGQLRILNIGIAAEEGELPFWVCQTDSRRSSFDRSLAERHPAYEIRVPCRKFRSILDDFGVPFYLKIDIQGSDHLCVEALDSAPPKFISIEFRLSDMPLLAMLHERGFKQFKCISQSHFLPLELPPAAEARVIQRAEWLRQNTNIFVRTLRKLGGSYWISRQFDRVRALDGWVFPVGSSGPFGDESPGRWLGYDEFCKTAREFLQWCQESPQTLLWASKGAISNPFWADLHARSQ